MVRRRVHKYIMWLEKFRDSTSYKLTYLILQFDKKFDNHSLFNNSHIFSVWSSNFLSSLCFWFVIFSCFVYVLFLRHQKCVDFLLIASVSQMKTNMYCIRFSDNSIESDSNPKKWKRYCKFDKFEVDSKSQFATSNFSLYCSFWGHCFIPDDTSEQLRDDDLELALVDTVNNNDEAPSPCHNYQRPLNFAREDANFNPQVRMWHFLALDNGMYLQFN